MLKWFETYKILKSNKSLKNKIYLHILILKFYRQCTGSEGDWRGRKGEKREGREIKEAAEDKG